MPLVTSSMVLFQIALIGGLAVIIQKYVQPYSPEPPVLTHALEKLVSNLQSKPDLLESFAAHILSLSKDTETVAENLFAANRILISGRCASSDEADKAFMALFNGGVKGGLTHVLFETLNSDYSAVSVQDYIERYLCVTTDESKSVKLLKKLNDIFYFSYELEMLKAAKVLRAANNRELLVMELCDRHQLASRGRKGAHTPSLANTFFHDQISRVLSDPAAKALCVMTAARAVSAGKKTSTMELIENDGHSVLNVLPCVIGADTAAALKLQSGKSLMVPIKSNPVLMALLQDLFSAQPDHEAQLKPLMNWDYWLIMNQ